MVSEMDTKKLIEKYREFIEDYEKRIRNMKNMDPEYFSGSIAKYQRHIKNIQKEIEFLERGDIEGYREFKKKLHGGE